MLTAHPHLLKDLTQTTTPFLACIHLQAGLIKAYARRRSTLWVKEGVKVSLCFALRCLYVI